MKPVRIHFRHARLLGALLSFALGNLASAQVEPPVPIDEVRSRARSADEKPTKPDMPRQAEPSAPQLNAPQPNAPQPNGDPPNAPQPNGDPPYAPQPSAPKKPAQVPGPSKSQKPPVVSNPKPTTAEPGRAFTPLLFSKATDDDLEAAWARWRRGMLEANLKLAESAQRDLVALKDDLGIADLDAFSIGFIRASEARIRMNDAMGAVGLSLAAVQLAPDLPHSHLALAHAYAFADPTDAPRYVLEFAQAVRCLWVDPRYFRPAAADVAVSVLFALLATTVAVIAVLFLRSARYFLHDFHHLFPRATIRWQSAAFALLLLSVPVVLRLGIMPALLIFFAATVAYLSSAERGVTSALIALVALTPFAGRWIASASSFTGTVAEDIYQLERGGPEAGASAEQVRHRVAEKRAEFEELFTLARYELRRGQLDAAISHFGEAASKRSNEPRLLTNLGNAMFAKGDVEGAAESYATAGSLDPSFAAAFYNLSVLYSRRAAALPAEAAVAETQKAQTAADVVQRLQPALLGRRDLNPETLANRVLLYPGLSVGEVLPLVETSDKDLKVQSQLSIQLLGSVDPSISLLYPLAVVLGMVGLAAAIRNAKLSKACMRCGRPVCRRCDPELSPGSVLCQQCVNAFARRNVVEASVKIRKQIEIAQFRAQTEKLTYAFGLLCSGGGHVFSGLPVRGAIYAFLFLFVLFTIVFRHGVLRYPYGSEPLFVQLAPLAVALIAVYLLSLRGLYKQQS